MKIARHLPMRSRRPDSLSRELHDDPTPVVVTFDHLRGSGMSGIVWQKGSDTDGYTSANGDFDYQFYDIAEGRVKQAVEKRSDNLPEGHSYKLTFNNYQGQTISRLLPRYSKTYFVFLHAGEVAITVDATACDEDVVFVGIQSVPYEAKGPDYQGWMFSGFRETFTQGNHIGGIGSDSDVEIEAALAALGTTTTGTVKGPIALDMLEAGVNWNKLTFSYSVRGCVFTKTLDRGFGCANQSVVIAPVGFGEPPSDIELSNSTLTGGGSATVGTLSATDSDVDDTAAFSLVDGDGSTHNGYFSIGGTTLRACTQFLAVGSYSVRIRVTDSEGLYFEKVFSITVVEPVFDISLSPASATALVSSGVFVGYFTVSLNGIFFRGVALVAGDGDTDNGKFASDYVVGNNTISAALSFRLNSSQLANQNGANVYSIRIRAYGPYSYINEAVLSVTINPAASSGSYGGGSG